jgi:DNA repair photolyase
MFRPIYEPRTRAREYSDLAINIYQGCGHGCTYCYAHKMFERYHPNENFSNVTVRPGIIEATKRQLSSGKYRDKKIMLCFMCDPYSCNVDTTPTKEIIKLIKEAGARVQILTKGGDRARRDFDLLDSGDSFGITLSCLSKHLAEAVEPGAALPEERIQTLADAAKLGIKTWVSFEPVMSPGEVLDAIDLLPIHINSYNNTLLKIGKLNHVANPTDWRSFGLLAEQTCKKNGWNYYIKEDLRALMKDEGVKG